MSDYALVWRDGTSRESERRAGSRSHPVVAPHRPAQAQLELRLWSPLTYEMPAATVEQLRDAEGQVSDTRN